MRIRHIQIGKWRNFENVELRLDEDASLVCLVGANGTGKSHILELIAACAHRFGLAPGIEIPRGDPFADPHAFSLQVFLAEGVSETLEEGLAIEEQRTAWDRTLTISSTKDSGTTILAGGIEENRQRENFAKRVIHHLQQSRDVHFLSLDADRAYPKRDINVNQLASAYEIDWTGTEYTRGRAFKPTTTLYDEWIKYFLAMENQAGTRLMQDTRRARKAGSEPPVFSDHFDDYATSLQTVLPHVVFTGVEPKKRTLLFDTTGLHLTFDQLSGGEREIAFLIGQIDRFGLRRGLFLLDEPELHLNADLIRSWVAYLTSTISTGQVWLATHSLEAVEAAGQHATFVLERDNVSRTVDRVARLDERPVLSALSRAVGTPAFSISQLVFVFVEGEEAVGERERFRKLAGMPQHIRFVECSSCNEVQRRVSAVRALAAESDAGIRIGGIVDRDFRSNADAEALRAGAGILVLPVHEIENLFLHPATLERILRQIGRTDVSPVGAIQAAADARAGSWVFQYSMATSLADDLPPIPEATKQRAKSMTWDHIARDGDAAIREITAASRFEATDADRYAKMLKVGINAYERKRQESDLWKLCEGKQVLPMIARTAGFAGPPALMSASYAVWDSEPELIPEELVELRRYLEAL